MKYIVELKLVGHSYIDGVTFTFDDRIEALDFAETARFRAGEGVLSKVSVYIVREGEEAEA